MSEHHHCPTCGSGTPVFTRIGYPGKCPDPWHHWPTCPSCGGTDRGVRDIPGSLPDSPILYGTDLIAAAARIRAAVRRDRRRRELEARVEAAHDAICYLVDHDGFAPDFGGPWVDEYDAAMRGRSDDHPCTSPMFRGAVTGWVIGCGVCDGCKSLDAPAAEPVEDRPDRMTTYRRADGGDIDGHSWVHTLDWFDWLDEPVELTEEVWVRKSIAVITVGPEQEDDDG